MSGPQRFFKSILPRRWAEDMEAESRQWMLRCNSCEFEESYWDMGGIRWKAAGNPTIRRRCPNCGRVGWHTVTRRLADSGGSSG